MLPRLFTLASALSLLLFAACLPGCIYIPVSESLIAQDPRKICGPHYPVHEGVTRQRVHEVLGEPYEVCTHHSNPFITETYTVTTSVSYFYIFADSPIGEKSMFKNYKVVVEYSNGELVSDCRMHAD